MTQHAKPIRAYRLTLELGADTAHDMATALISLADRIEREQVTTGMWGGPTDGGIYELLIDPNQTHEQYFKDVRAYLKDKQQEATHPMSRTGSRA